MKRFKKLNSLAGELQPGDCTKYEMVVVETLDTYEVIVMNSEFFDKLTFLKRDLVFYNSFRGYNRTNSWTIKAAKEMVERYLGIWKEEIKIG